MINKNNYNDNLKSTSEHYVYILTVCRVGSDHFRDEDMRVPIGKAKLPMVSQLVNGRARFQVL